MAPEIFCPEHGPFDVSYGTCPYCASEQPLPLKDDEQDQKTIRVFISSTYKDLVEYRDAAMKAVHSLLGYSDDMIFWSADERSPDKVSIERVKQCDVVILIVAHSYGFIPKNEQYSITEMEYRSARSANIPVLAFFVDDSILWPPAYVDAENKAALNNFKALVEKDVTRKIFSSPDMLNAMVTQSLVHFIERHRTLSASRKRFRGTVIVDSINQLETKPDALIRIGPANDKLPLLLQISRKRTDDLDRHLSSIADVVTPLGEEPPSELLYKFRHALEQYASTSWASHRIVPVQLKDGDLPQKMYVSENNLTSLFSSLCGRIFWTAKTSNKGVTNERKNDNWYLDDDTELGVVVSGDQSESKSHGIGQLQSVGGLNRFLGISIDTGEVYSVGLLYDEWVEWSPFYFESIDSHFPDAEIKISSNRITTKVPIGKYIGEIHEIALENASSEGILHATISLLLSRQAIGDKIVAIAQTLSELHSQGKIHGDIKPNNILFTQDQVTLIDDFSLDEGDISPGWTPEWSAPEQIIAEPVTARADVYPLGMMVLNLLGAMPVGEKRTFVTPRSTNQENEYNIFFNPSIYIDPASKVVRDGFRHWTKFVKSCLRYNPNERPASPMEFAAELMDLLNRYPLEGEVEIDIGQEQLVAATMLNGKQRVARRILDKISMPQHQFSRRPVSMPPRIFVSPLPQASTRQPTSAHPKADAWVITRDGRNCQLNRGETTIGRSSSSDIHLMSDATISKQHVKIIEQDGHFRLVDLGSSNGTKVNDKRVREPVLLENDDELCLGDHTVLRFVTSRYS